MTIAIGANKVVLVLVVLLTHNLASSFPQDYDYEIGAEPDGPGRNRSNPRFTCPEPTSIINCVCIYAIKDYAIHCPFSNPDITVNIDPGKIAKIQCNEKRNFSEMFVLTVDNASQVNISDMPMLTVGNTHQVEIHSCPLPQRQSIPQFISFLGVKNVKSFVYQTHAKNLGVHLVRQHFEGMQDLGKLCLRSGIEDIQPDLFTDLPHLKWLDLRENNVNLLHNIFDNLINLEMLELDDNQIAELEPAIFKNQNKLRHLNLSRNQLRNITKDSFRGAENLQELDLSANAIESLPEDAFSLLPNLSVLYLSVNRFVSLHELLLANNRKLNDLRLDNNQVPLQTLPENFLSNLLQLKTVKLQGCSFTNLPASLFRNSTDITDLDLSYNQLTSMPRLLLRDQRKLHDLNLAYNKLETLPEGLFENTKELQTLHLSFNRLYNLSATVFASLTKLTVLNLDNNHLHIIDKLTFHSTHALEKLYMQNNQLSFQTLEQDSVDGDNTPFQSLEELNVLNLRNNNITTIFNDWKFNNLQLRELDLSYNNISTLTYQDLQFLSQDIHVNLSHNQISKIHLKDMEPFITAAGQKDTSKIIVDINDNPLNCNCVIFSFVQYLLKELDKAVYNKVTLDATRLYCAEPKEHHGSLVGQLQTKNLLCPLDQLDSNIEQCPANCTCFVRPLDWGVIVNCTGQSLLEVPPLPQPTEFGFNFLELHIENNNITRLPTENLTGYAEVAELYAHNNAISQLEPENLPSSLRVLDVTKNRLTMLNQMVVEALNDSKQLESLRISDNKWSCDCASTQFLNFVQQNHKRIEGKVTCENGKEFDSITINDLCRENTTMIITISVVLSILGLLIGLFTVLYFTYHMEIKVWLFMHNLCMCWVSEEELDKDKLYDAFISYSHKDEDFITEHLMTTLEKEPMNFKTCWHVRDFMPGELIPTQIAKSVEDSRRTIVVLSKNFQESVWARMEFRTAHLNAMAENRARVIVIIYDDKLDLEHMDTELKAYLKLNTYVKWGDPWFWNKLRYAMPHPPAVKGLKRRGLTTNDDKLELTKPIPVTPPQHTTSPPEMNDPFDDKPVGKGSRDPNGGPSMKGHVANGHVNRTFTVSASSSAECKGINGLICRYARSAETSSISRHPGGGGAKERTSTIAMGANKVVLVLVALLTHNLASSFPQNYDYVIGANYAGTGAGSGGSSNPGAGSAGGRNSSEPRFTCPEPTPNIDCSCMYASADYEIQCPVINPEITVKILPGKYAQIQCYEKNEFSGMPMLTVGSTDQVKIIHCPLPQRKSIRQFISFLGVKNVKDFWYQNYGKDLGVRLVRQHFEGMQDLEKLFLSSGIEDIQPDLFADLPNLKWLILRSNHVKLLHNVFDNLTNLMILELGANQITELEPGLFKNQHKLRHLNLWRNQLRNITKESFRGAETLQELDLSVNAIESLQQDVFSLLPDLSVLNLSFNRFVSLPELLLADNRKLKEFRFINNQAPLQTLPENFLSNLLQLKTVILNRCSFTHLPASLLRGSTDITHLDLSYNQLISLPELLLRDQLKLQDLNLAYNELETLPEGLFENTKELLTLQLSFNRLYNLSATVFASLTKLTVLNLDNNHLHIIDRLTFSSTPALEKLYMQNNQLSFHSFSFVMEEQDFVDGDNTPFQYLNKLSVLNLRNNSITTIFRDWNFNNLALRELDLSYNNISTLSYLSLQFLSQDIHVNLSHNRISEIDLKDMEPIITSPGQQDKSKIQVDVNDNPLNCNCVIFSFVQYLLKELDSTVYSKVQLNANQLYCAEPKEHRGSLVGQLQTKDLLCPLDQPGTEIKHCPTNCTCFVRPLDRGVIVNCTGQSLLEVPPLPQPTEFGFNFLELHIEDNNITRLPTDNLTGYAKVAELYAHNNAISQLEPENLPSSLRILDVTKNRLTMLNQTVVEALNASKQLESLRLSDNKWSCDCASTQFLNFVQQNHKRIGDIGKVTCADGKEFDSITINDLCRENTTLIITVSVVLSILGLLIGLFTVLYFTYQMEIKVWLFMHNLCMWWVSEEELDKDKLYDAFISYSHKDEDFITEHLVTTLEKEPMNFKTCWHVRDFMPGELIPTQIAKSVEDSRRTIVVLSKNFQESVWARMEFRTAHLNAMAENRARVIVIIYDDDLDMEHMDTELKAYLKMNTYVKWGDPWFWDKLRYAMPHPPTVKGLKGKGLIKNHIKSSIDDKLELIKPVSVTPPQLTTPPAEMNGKRTAPFIISNGKPAGNGYHATNGGPITNGHVANGHVNRAFTINTNAKQSDV
ncbi:uncharacterized protein LOC129716702 [Wyeomyia smithii]|uniref:uncharacterized protein LOC129716702 n=1 Tax=Wyeomyia smithii TaxID=174621 RepID=UPI0024681D10|nr:uncharacterized protein LOC129716702 [Wyeomyia smithii]